MAGNMGERNLYRLQKLKNQLDQERQDTKVPRLAAYLDQNYEAYLLNDQKYPDVALILRNRYKALRTLGQDYYLMCAQEMFDAGLVSEDEEGNFHLKRVDNDEL